MKKRNTSFATVVVIGLGLIGGSVALELKKKGLAQKVIGISRSSQNRKEALRRKAVDEVFSEAGPCLKEAELIILATPVESILKLLPQIQKWLSPSTLVTDVGSSKSKIVAEARRLKMKQFVGGHPIAGTEHSGMKAAMLGLFSGKKWILTPHSPHSSLQKLKSTLKKMGAQVLELKAETHDKIFASVSHVPNLLAYILALTVGRQNAAQKISLAGSSLKGMTRVASSPPEMWRDVCLTNAKEISLSLADIQKEISSLQRLLKTANAKALMSMLEKGRRFRQLLEKVS